MAARRIAGAWAPVLGGVLAWALLGATPLPVQAQLKPSATYVAMGSSFAAGPGLLPYETGSPMRCARSTRNYAHLLAARRELVLKDVSCSGATTAAVLAPWRDEPAQIDAVGSATRWVTVTVGGNDVGYIGGLIEASCQQLLAQGRQPAPRCHSLGGAGDDAAFEALERSLRDIAVAVRQRAPQATLVWVDYPVVLPVEGGCEQAPLSPDQAREAHRLAARLEAVTARVAQDSGSLLLRASSLSLGHDVCSVMPWMWGYPAPAGGAPYHPNAQGMAAVADALDRLLRR
ncbi:SGNH/GDSL hydrolase family protein [Pelomonas cellulosilytica]|uniref:SGNH/GDSL hydrolase family protein n=1 Tax=Pelomonas cellulosilytica TaxID=2906762 RepID=A0ABS8XJ39_9BURK|nr:SGNH/GDSL hydrolase family protein [Pelomonas sp. P8]MCE4552887.1 SGNH/GDSL hydrolase family protein [Pelomonas sp. P8]